MSTAGNAQISYAFLKKTALFRGTTEAELPTLLGCIAPSYRDFAKNGTKNVTDNRLKMQKNELKIEKNC